jgi:Uma2 family endonuclease
MTSIATEPRPFQPGTTGWTVRDLDDPEIERQWFSGRYEIVEGVLTTMAAAYFPGGNATANVIVAIKEYLKPRGLPGRFAVELDIVVDDIRISRADAAMLLPADIARQEQASRKAGRRDFRRTRILIPPTLIIESVSSGHELHDEQTKRRWYAEFGVPNYWIVNAYELSFRCLVLRDGSYNDDSIGHGDEAIRPTLFPGLILPLKQIWES